MARLITSGFEITQAISTATTTSGESDADGVTLVSGGTVSIGTSVVRSGAAALTMAMGAANYAQISFTGVLDRAYFLRAYFRFTDATPSVQTPIITFRTGAGAVVTVTLETAGTLTLRDNALAAIGSTSSGLSNDTWYRVEVKVICPTASSGTAELYLDGSLVATTAAASVGNAALVQVRFGQTGAAASSGTIYVDDMAFNDDQTADQASYPGSGKVIVVLPVADSAIGTWVGPQTTGDDTTNLYDNVNNVPPQGVAHSDLDANAGFYVFNITNAASQNFDVAVTAYTTAGIVASDTIKLVQAFARMSCNTTTGTNTGAISGVSNPAITADTANNLELAAIAGTEPTGWKTFKTAPVYSPSVTLGTQPVLRATKEVANTNAAMVDLMGLVIEYEPASVGPTVKNLSALGVG